MSKLQVISQERKATNKTGAYIGFVALARVLAATKEPASAAQVAEATGISKIAAKRFLHQFRQLGLVHRVGWIKPAHGFSSPVYQIGEGEDCPPPIMDDGRIQPHADFEARIQPRVLTFASIVLSVRDEQRTAKDIIEQAQCGFANGRAAIKELRRHRIIYRAAWVRRDGNGGPWVACYMYGGCTEARRPELTPVRRRDETRRVFRPAWHNMLVTLRNQPLRCTPEREAA